MNSGRGCRDVKPVSNVNARDQISNRERERTGDKEKEERDREAGGGGGVEGVGTGIPGVRYTRQTGSMLPVCSRAFKQRVIDWLRVCQGNELEIFALAF